MSKSTIRKDKTCLNCRHVVEQKFCPNCGQENTESRKTFHYLFIHFFEDLTHYENAFWKTIRNLLFKPSTLTTEYLSGKRLSYLGPVRLYIFITFLLISFFPNHVSENFTKNEKEISTKILKRNKSGDTNTHKKDHIESTSMKEIDSIQKYGKEKEKLSEFQYWAYEKCVHVTENNTTSEIIEKFIESFLHNIPKILFIIMPFFAFFLWIFHDKKKWYYFDHGIFTLHYFSFLLLLFLIMFIIDKLIGLFGEDSPLAFVSTITNCVGYIWMCYYFYPAHHRFYGETRWISFFKSIVLLFINFFFVVLLLTFYIFYIFINLH
jgi:hypothetical protein